MTPDGPEPAKPGGEESGIATIQAMLDVGPSLLDTGDFYSMGANEALVGRAVKGRRDRAFISVKMGVMRAPGGEFIGFDTRPKAVKNFCTYSLQRLGIDHIDLYQPCRAVPDVPIEDTIGAIADLIQEGKVRHLGVSEFSAEQLRRAHATHPVTALEIEYSLSCRFLENEILDTARGLGIGIVPYGVITKGLLTGDFSSEIPPGAMLGMFPRFQGENLTRNLDAVKQLLVIAERKGATPAQIAIAWVLARYDMMIPIIGMSSPSRVPQNLAALSVELTATDLAELDSAFPPGAIVGDRYPGPLNEIVPF
jgi:aryl-alcohol dehydrogenase-like predicted oxidoreductase